jgi:hypothetical protein
LLPTLTEPELRQYTRRLQTDGELMAMEWLGAMEWLVAQRGQGR